MKPNKKRNKKNNNKAYRDDFENRKHKNYKRKKQQLKEMGL